MRTSLTLVALFLSIGLFAQPEILKEWAPDIGDSWSIRILVEVPDHGEGGADVVWDFTNLNANAAQFSLAYDWIDPAVTPYADSFPDATIAAKLGLGGFSNYGYYAETDDAFEYHGSATDFGYDIYIDPQTLKYVDLSYGEAVVDTYEAVFITTFSQPDTVTGYTSYAYDGYGTVKVGDLEVEDAIRIYQQDVVYDSSVTFALTDVFIDSTTTYAWIAEGTIFPVVQWQRSVTISRTYLNGTLIDESIEEPDTIFAFDPTYGGTSAVKEIAELPALELFPTATADMISVRCPGFAEVDYNIYSMNGKLVSSGKLTGGLSNINVNLMPSGWYVFQADGYRPERFIVQK